MESAGGKSPAGRQPFASSYSPNLTPGAEFGPRYRIEALLGEGGMGAVYKAHDKELDRTVALKLVRAELTADAEMMQRFKQELLLARTISQKNILRIHDLGDVGGIKFISMAYVEGEDLHHILKREHCLSPERALKIVRQICEGLDAAHAEGVIHRDLKPQNILMDKTGTAYITDFGLAKSLEAGAAGMTRTGQFVGTPRYMSPEQCEGDRLDGRSDIYSLGLILYEMVTGDLPFQSESMMQMMYARVKQKPRSPKLLNPELPDYLVRIIMRCLETDPARRYQNAREILADIDAERGTAPSLRMRVEWPSARSSRPMVALGIALSLVLLILLAIPATRKFIFHRASKEAPTAAVAPASAAEEYLAVLPFRVLGEQGALGYIADGLEESLSAKLFQLKNVHIAPSEEVAKANRDDPLEKLGRELGANQIVEGTVQGSGEKIDVIVNLMDAQSGHRLWMKEYSGVPQDLLTMEDEIYQGLVDALKLKPSNDEMARGVAHPTESIAAYDLYLKGRDSMRGQHDVNNVQKAIALYEEALKQDPNFAQAFAGIAEASLVVYHENKDPFWAQRALSAAQQGQYLNDKLAEVHFALGRAYIATGKYSEAVVELTRSVELAPNSDEGFRLLADAYQENNRPEEALRSYQKAVNINPYYWVNYNFLGNGYYAQGDYDKALAAYRRMTEIEPDNDFGYVNIGAVYFQQGKYSECVPWFQKALAIKPDYMTYSNLGTVYEYLKKYDDAIAMFQKAMDMNPHDLLPVGNLGDAYRWSGQKDKANATYEKAIALGNQELQVNPRKAATMGLMALDYAKEGKTSEARDFIRRARAIDSNTAELIYDDAVVEALAGKPDESIKALREAFRKGASPQDAVNEPDLKSIQTLPEFSQLIKEFSGKKS